MEVSERLRGCYAAAPVEGSAGGKKSDKREVRPDSSGNNFLSSCLHFLVELPANTFSSHKTLVLYDILSCALLCTNVTSDAN